jgi:hypothetical protein
LLGEEEVEVDPGEVPLTCGEAGGIVCPDPPNSSLAVTVEHIPNSQPPELQGGELQEGSYGLTTVQVYTATMLAGGDLPLTFDFVDFGTKGAVRIEGDAWSFMAELGLEFSSELGGNTFTGIQEGGGCISIYEGQVIGDILQCFGDNPDNSDAPTHFPYAVVGQDVQFMLSFPVTDLKASLEGTAAGGLASVLLVHDLKVLLTLSPL